MYLCRIFTSEPGRHFPRSPCPTPHPVRAFKAVFTAIPAGRDVWSALTKQSATTPAYLIQAIRRDCQIQFVSLDDTVCVRKGSPALSSWRQDASEGKRYEDDRGRAGHRPQDDKGFQWGFRLGQPHLLVPALLGLVVIVSAAND